MGNRRQWPGSELLFINGNGDEGAFVKVDVKPGHRGEVLQQALEVGQLLVVYLHDDQRVICILENGARRARQ